LTSGSVRKPVTRSVSRAKRQLLRRLHRERRIGGAAPRIGEYRSNADNRVTPDDRGAVDVAQPRE
jgi:hypothetical protein